MFWVPANIWRKRCCEGRRQSRHAALGRYLFSVGWSVYRLPLVGWVVWLAAVCSLVWFGWFGLVGLVGWIWFEWVWLLIIYRGNLFCLRFRPEPEVGIFMLRRLKYFDMRCALTIFFFFSSSLLLSSSTRKSFDPQRHSGQGHAVVTGAFPPPPPAVYTCLHFDRA